MKGLWKIWWYGSLWFLLGRLWRRTGWGKGVAIVGAGAWALIFLVVVAAISGGGGSSHAATGSGGTPAVHRSVLPYRVRASGSLPATQYMGQSITARIKVLNTGRAMSDMVLWVQGLGSWTMNTVTSSCDLNPSQVDVGGDGNAWAFGQILPGERCDVTLLLDPIKAGNPSLDISLYGGTQNGTVDTGKTLQGGAMRWTGAINP
ncbi:MAG: hypothetical protein ACRDFS_11745 [Chloroflexota bacterium]